MVNINTKSYWDNRFRSNDWILSGGEIQTKRFACEQIKFFKIPTTFDGTIVDFGCALGDAIPIYKRRFKNAKLIGFDISEEAIRKCKEKYGNIADFYQGTYLDVPKVDVIIASNVLEHLNDDKKIAEELLKKCNDLYITVPYKEVLSSCGEHVNSYDEHSFDYLNPIDYHIYKSKGLMCCNSIFIDVYVKNIIRPLLGKKIVKPKYEIIYHFQNKK
ncbi:Methyltransferase type 12 [Thermoanaerobacterium thermosaccharolyticum DSM 571]|uniref:Methyltransferase type 12 n=1 Tax=Thermoanaerobacterium thermosaccharolyticum (strain ATCC 7956 / DSM 571 / NCIMB 9385 / NCA 3814 / NCTC 13789 / WDCM 00135 / 2032) TaxID=580327 RepID=D9TMG0_THETC|nr:class I SAM-dependent methyltransferase [Thermoanaerobacterium thermosaccharolyticum]ADL68448.1 Methyltransferase type 12 [Thermoanaerobacterium thermosaccharolyticum DSM 571]